VIDFFQINIHYLAIEIFWIALPNT